MSKFRKRIVVTSYVVKFTKMFIDVFDSSAKGVGFSEQPGERGRTPYFSGRYGSLREDWPISASEMYTNGNRVNGWEELKKRCTI